MTEFLENSKYVDYFDESIQTLAKKLFSDLHNDVEKAKAAFEFVRDNIPHSFDIKAEVVTVKASDVLKYKTGICFAKSNLLAALLRSQGIKTGFCLQHLTLADDDSMGYCLHCFNAVFLNEKWIYLDARGNKSGVNAQFSLDEPILAFQIRKEYDEYFINGIFSKPDRNVMQILECCNSVDDVMKQLPDKTDEVCDLPNNL